MKKQVYNLADLTSDRETLDLNRIARHKLKENFIVKSMKKQTKKTKKPKGWYILSSPSADNACWVDTDHALSRFKDTNELIEWSTRWRMYDTKDLKREKLIAYLIGVVIGMAIGSYIFRIFI